MFHDEPTVNKDITTRYMQGRFPYNCTVIFDKQSTLENSTDYMKSMYIIRGLYLEISKRAPSAPSYVIELYKTAMEELLKAVYRSPNKTVIGTSIIKLGPRVVVTGNGSRTLDHVLQYNSYLINPLAADGDSLNVEKQKLYAFQSGQIPFAGYEVIDLGGIGLSEVINTIRRRG